MRIHDRIPWTARQRTVLGVPLSPGEFALLFGGWALFILIVMASLPFALRAAVSLWERLS
jgi:hypothetical protein